MKRASLVVSLMLALFLIGGCSNIIPPSDGNIKGKVMDQESISISGAIVEIENTTKSVQTTSNGLFSINDLAAGNYSVKVTKDGFQASTKTVKVYPGEDSQVEFILQPVINQGSIEGTVLYQGTDEPVEGVIVKVSGTDLETKTDIFGEFTFTNLVFDTYTLSLSKEQFVSTTQKVEVNADQVKVSVEIEEYFMDAPAKTLVNNFKTSMYQVGTIYFDEESIVVNNIENELMPFMGKIGPSLEEFAKGLGNLEVIEYVPGKYEYVESSSVYEWGWDYVLIEEGSFTADPVIWEVVDNRHNVTVTISASNINQMIQENAEGTQIDIDLRDVTFDVAVTSNTSNANYTANVDISDTNAETFTHRDFYDEDGDGVEETHVTNITIPTGSTANFSCVVDLDTWDPSNDMEMNGQLNLDLLTNDLLVDFSGSITTDIFEFQGNAGLKLQNVDVSHLEKLDSPHPFSVNIFGEFVTPKYKVSGDFQVAFGIVPGAYLVPDFEDIIPYYADMGITYSSDRVDFQGNIVYEFVNYDTYYTDSSFSVYKDIQFEVEGNLADKIKNKEYNLNLYFYKPEKAEEIQIDMDLQTSGFSLTGETVVMLSTGFVDISVMDNNLTHLKINVSENNVSGEEVGSITYKDGLKYADIILNLDEFGMPSVTIEYTDGSWEVIPLNPLDYL